ncbi:hypothetical protein B0H17DRAFT_1132305 [Mycena rosella]|uniref:Uncharacterized protein n=1 Tax=Mycena rosella TaxID=1033263 RepID=A0AAD7DM32_MYCRO|nr:hypothetical protein B0H17DRAFT_1132305 [Mycena rosella]
MVDSKRRGWRVARSELDLHGRTRTDGEHVHTRVGCRDNPALFNPAASMASVYLGIVVHLFPVVRAENVPFELGRKLGKLSLPNLIRSASGTRKPPTAYFNRGKANIRVFNSKFPLSKKTNSSLRMSDLPSASKTRYWDLEDQFAGLGIAHGAKDAFHPCAARRSPNTPQVRSQGPGRLAKGRFRLSSLKQTEMCMMPHPQGGTLWIPPPRHAGAPRTNGLARFARSIKRTFTINHWTRLPDCFSQIFPSYSMTSSSWIAQYLRDVQEAPSVCEG